MIYDFPKVMSEMSPKPGMNAPQLAPMEKGPREPKGTAKKHADIELDTRADYAPPSYDAGNLGGDPSWTEYEPEQANKNPNWMPRGMTHFPVKYTVPTEEKEDLDRRAVVSKAGGVTRTLPIDKELGYMKYMQDMADLAKFDNYVEALVDPKQPGSADFLFKVYPEYVNRRMQQAHTDYEFALRNQMIDMWGINTFDDLYFKYMVDQKKISGPKLTRSDNAPLDDKYVTWNFMAKRWRAEQDVQTLHMPFSSSTIGSRGFPGGIDRGAANLPGNAQADMGSMARSLFGLQNGRGANAAFRPRPGMQ